MALPKLQQIFFALSNPRRIKIYQLCLREKLNITQIANKLNQSYKSVFYNIKVLDESGLMIKEKVITKTSQESFMTSIPLDKDSVYYKVLQEILKENTKQK